LQFTTGTPTPLLPPQVTSAKQVELASLIDAASCIRTAPRVTGALVIWDDGTIPDLSALGNLKTVSGPLVLFGVNGNSSIASLAGLEKLEVSGRGQQSCRRAWPPACQGDGSRGPLLLMKQSCMQVRPAAPAFQSVIQSPLP
jgi:hypothetical protein